MNYLPLLSPLFLFPFILLSLYLQLPVAPYSSSATQPWLHIAILLFLGHLQQSCGSWCIRPYCWNIPNMRSRVFPFMDKFPVPSFLLLILITYISSCIPCCWYLHSIYSYLVLPVSTPFEPTTICCCVHSLFGYFGYKRQSAQPPLVF